MKQPNSADIILKQLGLPLTGDWVKHINWSSTKKGSGRRHCIARRKNK